MLPLLYPARYSHVVELILSLVDFQSRLSVRLVQRELRDAVDRVMSRKVIQIRKRGVDTVFIGYENRPIPHFHPDAPLPPQENSFSRASSVFIENKVTPTPRMNSLLQRLQPTAQVTIYHYHGPCAFQLPAIKRLVIRIPAACKCESLGAPLSTIRHAAGRVYLFAEQAQANGQENRWRAAPPRCGLVNSLVTPELLHLFVQTKDLDQMRNIFDLQRLRRTRNEAISVVGCLRSGGNPKPTLVGMFRISPSQCQDGHNRA